MKKYLLVMFFYFLVLPTFGLEEASFEPKYKRVTLNKNALQTIKLKTEKVYEKLVDETISVTGQIEGIPANHFDINTPVQGTVSQVLIDLGDKVKVGQSVATVESPEISRLQAEIEKAKADLELAKINFEREKKLYEKGVAPKKNFDISNANLLSAEANLNAAQSNLKILTMFATTNEQGVFEIKARKGGTITERNITVGQVVNSNQILFHGIDLSKVWASADIYEKDISKVAPGQTVNVSLDGNPSKVFKGVLTYIGSVINEKSRTLPVKGLLDNYGDVLKPGAFVQLTVQTNKQKETIVIPITALVDIDDGKPDGKHEHIVYVKEDETFAPRKIKVLNHDSSFVEVLDGLMSGETIVTSGAYQLQYAGGENKDEKVIYRDADREEHSKSNNHSKPYLQWIGIIVGVLIIFLIVRKLFFKSKI